MCTYVLDESHPSRPCEMASYFQRASRTTQPGHSPLIFPELPVDKAGLCIFHSREIDWKLKNKLDKWIKHLVSYLEWLDRTPFMLSPTGNNQKRVDLSGVFLVAKESKLRGGAMETVLRFRDLGLKESILIQLDYAYFGCKVVFEQCNIPGVELSFNHTTLNGEMLISNCALTQLSFNNTMLNGGLIVNNCELSRYGEFGGMIVSNIFQLSNSHFEADTFFSSSNFRCEMVVFENVEFLGKADFNLCTFHGDVEIQECQFEKLVNFSDARFNSTVEFSGNFYEDNVQFTSTGQNKVFYDNVRFTFGDPDSEVQGRLIFDNVNFFLIAGKDREQLMALARENKVTIGSGCIKYRVQTPPVSIETNDINKNIARELAQSFTNYFVSSTGKSLGVEFTDNTISRITLFYFTDEDISLEELMTRLKMAEVSYWSSGAPGPDDKEPDEIKRKVDSFIGKMAIMMKMSMLQQHGLLPEETIWEIVKAIGFNNEHDRANQIQLTINLINEMKIGKVVAQPNSQVNIAENIDKIEFNPVSNQLSQRERQQIKEILLRLDPEEVQELRQVVAISLPETETPKLAQRVRVKLNEFAIRHGVPIVEGLASSAIFEFLKLAVTGG